MGNSENIAEAYEKLQTEICKILENADGKGKFNKYPWNKKLGRGLTCVMENGKIIEKAGVNFSFVSGDMNEQMKKTLEINADGKVQYTATGISSIIHSSNPFVPTIHFNVRYFGLSNGVDWFGGGIDLTPIYVDTKEAQKFHITVKAICDKYDTTYYEEFKKWADDYFFLPHRNETRGVGGIFFDRISPKNEYQFEQVFSFTRDLAIAYPEIYANIMKNKGSRDYAEQHKEWQKIRRGRYVEFNLLYDRGTKFGIQTGGNTESILVSLPAEVNWKYNYSPPEHSKEWETLRQLRKGIEWISGNKNKE